MSHPTHRSGLATAAAILMITWGSLGLFGGVCGVGAMMMQQAFQPPVGPGEEQPFLGLVDPDVAKEVPSAPAVEISAYGLNLLLSAAMIAAGIGILQTRPLARVSGMILALTDILVTFLHTGYSILLTLPVQHRLLGEEAQNLPPGFDPIQMLQASMWGGAVMTLVFTLAVQLAVFFMLNSKSAKASFAEEFEPTDPRPRDEGRSRYDDYDDDLPPPRLSGDTGITDRPS